jgi:hypothetical protein
MQLLQQRGPMLRGVLSLLENRIVPTEALNDSAVEDDLASTTDPRDKEIMARLNPFASEEEAAARFSNSDGYVPADHDPWILPNVTAMETQKALMTHVFSIFGFPLVMVSDTGPAFRSDLQGHMADFFGFRHIPILPYNAAANGTAEASVKRIKLLLDRHTKGYAEWHHVLPLAQLQLNSHVHTGTDMSLYMALFGRAPHGIAQLENPSLLSKTGSGSEWLKTVRGMFVRMHADIQKASDDLKRAHAEEANARTSSDLDPRAGQIKLGGWVRII